MATVTVHITETSTFVYELEVPDAHLNEEFPTPGDPGNWGPRSVEDVLKDLGHTAETIRVQGVVVGYIDRVDEIEKVTA